MYTTPIFEKAVSICGYKLDKVFYTQKSKEIRKAEGRVPIVKKENINGEIKLTTFHKRVRWDATGHCFSQRGNIRKRKYDIPVSEVML